MNVMCDLIHAAVSILVSEATSDMLSKLFMKQVVFIFDMAAVVVVYTDSKFLHLFEEMCEVLGFKFWPLSRGNYKGNSVERYHRFLSKYKPLLFKIKVLISLSSKIAKNHNTLGIVHQSMTQILQDTLLLWDDTSNFL